jgi:hypothetical protein
MSPTGRRPEVITLGFGLKLGIALYGRTPTLVTVPLQLSRETMNQASLSSVTLATIENYRNAANEATRAYQAGTQRLIDGLNKGINEQVYSRTSKVAPNLTDALSNVRGRMTEIVIKGIDEITSRTEKAVEVGSDGVAKQVNRAAEIVAGIDNVMLANGLQVAARLSLPGAKVALAVSGKVAEGAKALSGAAAGKGFKAAAEAAVRSTKRKGAAVSRRAAKTVKKTAVRAKRKLA